MKNSFMPFSLLYVFKIQKYGIQSTDQDLIYFSLSEFKK